MDVNERELIRQAQNGSIDAFDSLVRLHDRKILTIILSVMRDRNDAYDVYQETFIRAFKKIHSFRFESMFSTWLGRIAINQSINWRKRMHRRNLFSIDEESERGGQFQLASGEDAKPASDSDLIDHELHEMLDHQLKMLPVQQRTAFILKHRNGYKIKEIAEMMDCAEGTVKNHLFRATNRLKKIMHPYYNGE